MNVLWPAVKNALIFSIAYAAMNEFLQGFPEDYTFSIAYAAMNATWP